MHVKFWRIVCKSEECNYGTKIINVSLVQRGAYCKRALIFFSVPLDIRNDDIKSREEPAVDGNIMRRSAEGCRAVEEEVV